MIIKNTISKYLLTITAILSWCALITGFAVTFQGGTRVTDLIKDLDSYKGMGLLPSHIGFILAGSIIAGITAIITTYISFKLWLGAMEMSWIIVMAMSIFAFAIAVAVFACVGDLKNDTWVATQVAKKLVSVINNYWTP